MDFTTETGSENVDSSSLPDILTEISQNVQEMLRLIQDNETVSTEKFLSLYQSLGERYNDLNQEMLKFDIKLSCSDHTNDSSLVVTPKAHSSLFKHESSSSHLGSVAFNSSLKYYPVSVGKKTSSEMVEKSQSAFMLADIFRGELETALRELDARNVDIETERRRVVELESELEQTQEILEVSEIEVSKVMEMWKGCKTEIAKLQTDNGSDLLDSLREELRSREIQIEQMEEYLNQVCVQDTEVITESRTDENVVEEELRARVEELEEQVELQRNVILEREEDKREAIRQLCFSLDHYKSRYIENVRSLSGNNN